MVEPIQNFGDTRHPKRKRESDFKIAGKKSRQFFCPLRFYKTVTDVTVLTCYINAIGL